MTTKRRQRPTFLAPSDILAIFVTGMAAGVVIAYAAVLLATAR